MSVCLFVTNSLSCSIVCVCVGWGMEGVRGGEVEALGRQHKRWQACSLLYQRRISQPYLDFSACSRSTRCAHYCALQLRYLQIVHIMYIRHFEWISQGMFRILLMNFAKFDAVSPTSVTSCRTIECSRNWSDCRKSQIVAGSQCSPTL